MLKKRWIVFTNLAFFILGIAGLFLAMASFMLFDAPGSENNTYVWILFFASLLFPVSCFLSCIISLITLLKFKKNKPALWIAFIPCIIILVLIIDVSLLQLNCEGNLSCPVVADKK